MKKHETLLKLLSAILACSCIDQATRARATDLKRRVYKDVYGSEMLADIFAGI